MGDRRGPQASGLAKRRLQNSITLVNPFGVMYFRIGQKRVPEPRGAAGGSDPICAHAAWHTRRFGECWPEWVCCRRWHGNRHSLVTEF